MAAEKSVHKSGQKDAGNYAAKGGRQGAGNTGNLKAYKSGGIYCQRPWSHLGDGDNISKDFLGNPAVFVYYLFLN